MSGVKAVAASSVGAFDAAAAKLDGAGLREATAGAMARFAVYQRQRRERRARARGRRALDATLTPSGSTGGSTIAFSRLAEERRRRLGRDPPRRRGAWSLTRRTRTYSAFYVVERSGTYDLDVRVGGSRIGGLSAAMSVTASRRHRRVYDHDAGFHGSARLPDHLGCGRDGDHARPRRWTRSIARCYADAGVAAPTSSASAVTDGSASKSPARTFR